MVLRLGLAGLVAVGAAAAADTQSWTVSLPQGRTLSVQVTVGDLRIQGEPRRDALVEISRTAPRRDDLALIPVDIRETPEHVTIDATQRDGGTNPALRTDVRLRVPHEAALQAVTVFEGQLNLSDLAGAVTADVRRGSITASALAGIVRLETGMGDITATRMRLTGDGLLRLRAFNGDLRLTLVERPTHARVMALALNGTIRSDIPLRTRDGWGPRWAETTLGRGEPVISLDVVTGTIEIKAP